MQMARSKKAEAEYEAKGARPRGKTVGVRLSEAEIVAAEALRVTPKESLAAVLRRLLLDRTRSR